MGFFHLARPRTGDIQGDDAVFFDEARDLYRSFARFPMISVDQEIGFFLIQTKRGGLLGAALEFIKIKNHRAVARDHVVKGAVEVVATFKFDQGIAIGNAAVLGEAPRWARPTAGNSAGERRIQRPAIDPSLSAGDEFNHDGSSANGQIARSKL